MVTISVLDFDRTATKPQIMNSPRTVLACVQEGLDPAVDFLPKRLEDFVLQCKGDRVAAKLRLEHYLERRDELLEIVQRKREVIIESLEEHESLRRSNADMRQASPSPPGTMTSGTGTATSDGTISEPEDGAGDTSAQRQQHALSKKQKLERQIERMKQVVENNKIRQQQAEAEAARKLQLMSEQEQERHRQKEQQELERKFKEVQLRRRAQQERQLRQQREEEAAQRLEEERQHRTEIAEELAVKEEARQKKLLRERRRIERERIEKQVEVAQRLEEKKMVAELTERERRELIEEKMREADRRRERLEAMQEDRLAAQKVTSEIKSKENKEKRQKASALFVQRITRFVEKAKIAEEQQKKQEEEQKKYYLHCKLEEAKREKLRKEVLLRAEEEEAQREQEMQERLQEAEARIREIMHEKERNAALRKVEKEMLLEDKLQQMLRNRRLLEHECEEGKARYEQKIKKITDMQRESQDADRQRRDLMRRSLLAIKKRDPEPTPGPLDYAVDTSSNYIASHDGAVKISNAVRKPLFAVGLADDTPGPGQYNAIRKSHPRGGKLRPLTVLEQRERSSQRHRNSPQRAASSLSTPTPIMDRASASPSSVPNGSLLLHNSSVNSTARSLPVEVSEADYNSEDYD